MKTLTSFLSICFVSIILFALSSGCSHNNSGTLGPPSSYKVKTIISEYPNNAPLDTLIFTYDAMGRVLAGVPKWQHSYDVTYYYSGNNMDIYYYDYAPNTPIPCTLNPQGLLDSVFLDDTYNIPRQVVAKNIYDANGFVVRQIQKDSSYKYHAPGNVRSYNWVDSCLMSFTDSTNGRSLTYTSTYTYYNIREYRDNGLQDIYNVPKIPNTIVNGYVLVLGSLWGGHSKYLIKSRTYDNQTINFTYTFDPYGRVTTQTEIGPDGTAVFKYTYY